MAPKTTTIENRKRKAEASSSAAAAATRPPSQRTIHSNSSSTNKKASDMWSKLPEVVASNVLSFLHPIYKQKSTRKEAANIDPKQFQDLVNFGYVSKSCQEQYKSILRKIPKRLTMDLLINHIPTLVFFANQHVECDEIDSHVNTESRITTRLNLAHLEIILYAVRNLDLSPLKKIDIKNLAYLKGVEHDDGYYNREATRSSYVAAGNENTMLDAIFSGIPHTVFLPSWKVCTGLDENRVTTTLTGILEEIFSKIQTPSQILEFGFHVARRQIAFEKNPYRKFIDKVACTLQTLHFSADRIPNDESEGFELILPLLKEELPHLIQRMPNLKSLKIPRLLYVRGDHNVMGFRIESDSIEDVDCYHSGSIYLDCPNLKSVNTAAMPVFHSNSTQKLETVVCTQLRNGHVEQFWRIICVLSSILELLALLQIWESSNPAGKIFLLFKNL